MANSIRPTALENRYFTAEQLNAMSAEDLNRYCFVSGKKEDWDNDFNKEICDNIDRYDILKTLSGEPLGYIKTRIDMTMFPWIPEGKKLNPKLLYALQTILAKNPAQTRNAALTGKTNSFIIKSCLKLTEIIEKAFACEVETLFDED